MILYKNTDDKRVKNMHKHKTIKMNIEELPTRKKWEFKSTKDKVKFIKSVEALIRHSMEYKEYIKFLKTKMDMNHCIVLKNCVNGNGKRYSIEIHHEPFGLYEIVETVVNKWQSLDEPLNIFKIADEVMELHYSGLVGLIPLSKTQHELVGNGLLFIPLQLVYQDYDKFYEQYEDFMEESLKEKIEAKVQLSLKCGEIQSDVLETEFVYVDVDGFQFPQVPEEWKNVMNRNSEEKETE